MSAYSVRRRVVRGIGCLLIRRLSYLDDWSKIVPKQGLSMYVDLEQNGARDDWDRVPTALKAPWGKELLEMCGDNYGVWEAGAAAAFGQCVDSRGVAVFPLSLYRAAGLALPRLNMDVGEVRFELLLEWLGRHRLSSHHHEDKALIAIRFYLPDSPEGPLPPGFWQAIECAHRRVADEHDG